MWSGLCCWDPCLMKPFREILRKTLAMLTSVCLTFGLYAQISMSCHSLRVLHVSARQDSHICRVSTGFHVSVAEIRKMC
jgi:hypothetical protein